MCNKAPLDYRVERHALANAIARCTNKNHAQYKDYGGRGITVHWSFFGPNGFKNFLAAVGPKPSPELTLDRIDNNKGYEPGNLCWATRTQQQFNRRKQKCRVEDLGWGLKPMKTTCINGRQFTIRSPIVECNGQAKSLREWSEELGLSTRTLKQRLMRGIKPEQALVSSRLNASRKPKSGPTIH